MIRKTLIAKAEPTMSTRSIWRNGWRSASVRSRP